MLQSTVGDSSEPVKAVRPRGATNDLQAAASIFLNTICDNCNCTCDTINVQIRKKIQEAWESVVTKPDFKTCPIQDIPGLALRKCTKVRRIHVEVSSLQDCSWVSKFRHLDTKIYEKSFSRHLNLWQGCYPTETQASKSSSFCPVSTLCIADFLLGRCGPLHLQVTILRKFLALHSTEGDMTRTHGRHGVFLKSQPVSDRMV